MTGVEILREFNREVFKAYSTYYNPTKMNDLLKKALIDSLEDQYNNLLDQKNFDAMSPVIKLNKVFSINNNQINTAPLDIINITHPAAFVITTRVQHNMAVGDSFTIANVAGFTTSVNGVQVVTAITDSYSFGFAATFTGGTYTANTGQITTHTLSGVSKIATDYNHLLAVRAKYETTLSYGIADITNTQPIKIILGTINNNIVSGELINISGVLVNTNANGDRYMKKVNRKTYALYYDEELTNSTSGNGSYQGLPVLKRVNYNFAVPVISIEKISNYDIASVQKPEFERGEKMIRILPDAIPCTEITMDYISNAVVFIDTANSTINLEDTYSLPFLYQVITKAVQLFASEVNDKDKYETSTAEIQSEK